MSRIHASLFALFIFSIASRAAFFRLSTNMFDSASYVKLVRNLLANDHWIIFTNFETGHPVYVQLCAFTAWITKLLGLTNDVVLGIKITGIVVAATTVWPVYWLARWLLDEERHALLATLIYSIIPIAWWWAGETMSDSVGLAFVVWPFGCLALWRMRGGRTPLVLASLWMGMSPLVRFSSLSNLPLYGLILLIGVWRSGRYKQLFSVLLIPLPLVLYAIWAFAAHPYLTYDGLFSMTEQNNMDFGRMLLDHRWRDMSEHLTHSFSLIGLIVATSGLILACFSNRWLVVFTVLWCGPLIGPQLVLPVTVIRYYLPLAPVVAICAVYLIKRLNDRSPPGSYWGGVVSGAVVVTMVLHALPDLRVMRDRDNFLDALPRWYAEHTELRDAIIGDAEIDHIRVFAPGREALFYCADGHEHFPWLAGYDLTFPEVALRIERALGDERSVWMSDALGEGQVSRLQSHFRLEHRGSLLAHELRNLFDIGFGRMGEWMARTRRIEMFRIVGWRETALVRPSAPPVVTAVDRRLTLKIHSPKLAGVTCTPVVAASSAALDWTEPSFKDDPMFQATAASWAGLALTLDDKGRVEAEFEFPVPVTEPTTIWVGYVAAHDGRVFVAAPTRLDLRPSAQ